MDSSRKNSPSEAAAVSFGRIFLIFLRLGLTSFGGPVAHLSYFRREFVERRKWLGEGEFGQLVAISQFLPGPGSSQLGFSIGLLKGGWLGGLMAFLAFTLPSALLLFCFAESLPYLQSPIGQAAIHGLKIVALAVVAHGVLGMIRGLCPDAVRRMIGILVAVVILLTSSAWVQLAMVALGAIAGLTFCRKETPQAEKVLKVGYGKCGSAVLVTTFALLLILLPILAASSGGFEIAASFYQAGALVFGGGHVVLPLLEESVVAPGWISEETFLAGYGAAQAIPGPMFAFASYLGAVLPPEIGGGWRGAGLAVLAIFLPGMLLMSGFLPIWQKVSRHPRAAQGIAGVNAAVVGILSAALYDPILTSAIRNPYDLVIGLIGFLLLAKWRLSPLIVVLWCVAASLLVSLK